MVLPQKIHSVSFVRLPSGPSLGSPAGRVQSPGRGCLRPRSVVSGQPRVLASLAGRGCTPVGNVMVPVSGGRTCARNQRLPRPIGCRCRPAPASPGRCRYFHPVGLTSWHARPWGHEGPRLLDDRSVFGKAANLLRFHIPLHS